MAEDFRNRKSFMSLNIQFVCALNLEFLNIVIRCPGSAHDNRIFENSGVMVSFEDGRRSGILLGDSGYGQKPYLFTPVPNPQNEAENRYNRAHVKTRNIVERSFGAWKRKFSCLPKKLNIKHKTTTRIIAVCAVLHSVALRYGQDDHFEFHDRVVPVEALEDRPRGRAIRAAFIERHFRI
ncbi:putative nuclease HARBI1 [Blattella germanica]|nr:putative nuclease HARBI1 [Blattella germanica]